MRAAINGATVANEIRAIAAGLSGSKTVKAIEVKSLMIDTAVTRSTNRKASPKNKARAGAKGSIDDQSSAESYYRAWKRSLETKLKDAGAGAIESTANKPSPSPSPKAITKRSRRS